MIYGYVEMVVNQQFGLSQMREVSVAADSSALRALAEFLRFAAEQLDAEERTTLWHLHVPDELRNSLGCDFVVLAPEDDNRPDAVIPILDE